MTTRYQEKYYEDVVQILSALLADTTALDSFTKFADLFAADNPPTCIDCGASPSESGPFGSECAGHLFEGGFGRADFLAACGLESEG